MGEHTATSNIKLGRHHTDIVSSPVRRGFDSDVIIEEDYNVDSRQAPRKSIKKSILVTRHNTEVLRKRPPDPDLTSFKQKEEVKVTRRSLSRHGSRVQQGSKVRVIDESESPTARVIKSLTKNKSANKRRKELEEQTRTKLNQHADSTSSFDTKTPGFEQAFLKLQQCGSIVLTGSLGTGKTFTALNLVEAIVDSHEDYRPIILQSEADLHVVVDTPVALVVLADDFLGKVFYNPSYIASWNRVTSHVTSLVRRRRIFLILTCETESLHFIQSELFSEVIQNIPVIDLDSEDYALSSQYCNRMHKAYQKMSRHSQKDNHSLTGIESGPFGFPLLCRFAVLGDLNSNCQQPQDFLMTKIEELRNQEFLHYLVLVLTTLLGGKFPLTGFTKEQKTIFDMLFKLYKIEISSTDDLVVVARQLLDIYLFDDVDIDCFEFLHASFYYATLFSFIQEHDDDAIELAPLQDIAIAFGFKKYGNRVWDLVGQSVSPELTQNELNLVLSRYKSALDSKLTRAFADVASSVMWRSDVFVDLALAILGITFFLTEDDTHTFFTVHLIRNGHQNAIIKVLNFISQYRRDNVADILSKIKVTLCSLCLETQETDFESVLPLLPSVDTSLVCAAAKGGNVETMKVLLNNGGSFFTKKNEIFETVCSYSHMELLEFMFAQLDSESQIAVQKKRDSDGKTIVHFAAMALDTLPLEFLLNRGGDPTASTKDGFSILHIASCYGRLELVKHICACFPDLIPHTDNNGFTCAHFAALEGHVDVLQFLLSQNVDPTLLVKGQNTIFHLAAYNGRNEVIRLLCHRYPQLIGAKNVESYTAPQMSTISGHLDTLKVFFSFSFDHLCKTVDGRTFLHLAAFHGKLHTVRYLCDNYADLIRLLDNDGNTAAHDAAASGNVPVFEYLTNNHINPNVRSYDGCTLLHDACYYGRKSTVQYICDHYPGLLDVVTTNGYSACHGSALGGFVEIFTLLADRGSDPHALSSDESTVLHEAAYSGKLKMIQYLCARYPGMVKKRNKRSYLPVHFAAQEGHLNVLQYLLSKSNDWMSTTEEQQTFLHIACYNGRMNVAKYLCEQIPDMITRVDANGASAIHYAARGGHIEILTYFIDLPVDPFTRTENESTILHLAAYDGMLETVKHICRKYPQLIQAVDKFRHNAAHYAAGSGNLELLKFLLNEGIDPYLLTDNDGNMFLKASYNGKLNIVQYICETYPELIVKVDAFGCNVAHYAVCAGSVDVLKCVIEHGVDPLMRTTDGHTLLHIAAFHGQLDMVDFLYNKYPAMWRVTDKSGNTAEKYADLGEQKHVVAFLQNRQRLDGPKQVGGESTECVSCFSAKGIRNCCGQISAIFCFCRRK